MKIDAVIFDLDGVLIDSAPFWGPAIQSAMLNFFQTEVDMNLLADANGLRMDKVISLLISHYRWETKLDPMQISHYVYSLVATEIRKWGKAIDGVYEGLDFLGRKNFPLAIASSSFMSVIEAALERLEIAQLFSHICSAEHEEYGKPHPGVYLRAISHLGVDPGNCLIIEDSWHGLCAGVASDAQVIVVGKYYNDAKFLEIAVAGIPDLSHLERLWRLLEA